MRRILFGVLFTTLICAGLLVYMTISRPIVSVEDKVVELHITLQDSDVPVSKLTNKNLRNIPGKAICSGLFIDSNGAILTARHCTEGVERMDVLTSDHSVYSAYFVARSNIHDLALIRIDKKDTPFFKLATLVTRGEKVSVLGSPLGETNVLSEGIVAALKGDQTIIDCSVVPGNSGGPVFDVTGQLVGVAVAVYVSDYGMTHLGLIENTDAIQSFLKEVLRRKNYVR